jgi:hypothetical protein
MTLQEFQEIVERHISPVRQEYDGYYQWGPFSYSRSGDYVNVDDLRAAMSNAYSEIFGDQDGSV